MRNAMTAAALSAVLPLTLAAGPSLAAGAAAERAWERSTGCLTSATSGGGDLASGADCIGNRLGGLLLDETARVLADRGRAMFGENFRLAHRMAWAPFGNGLAGELDMVVPLGFTGTARADGEGDALYRSTFFFQQGVTRWRDRHGLQRNDLRLGTAFRFTLPHFAGENVVGASAFVQENIEWGHQRLVVGADYIGRWGRAALHHYTPVTSWRDGRSGYEERAVGGAELSLQLDLTTTLSFDTAVGRWERDDAGRSTIDGRLGLVWRPHPYLRFDAGTEVGSEEESGGSFLVSLNVPFGGTQKPPKWEGLGAFGMAGESAGVDMWRPVDTVGRIRTIERTVEGTDAQESEVSARFLQSSTASGGEIEVEVLLSAPASEAVRVTVRLAGSGDNPAVAGIDFPDEPKTVTIPSGDTSAQVTFQLISNPRLSSERTLTVVASLANGSQ